MKWKKRLHCVAVALVFLAHEAYADELPERASRVTESVIKGTSKVTAEQLPQPLALDGDLVELPLLAAPRPRRNGDTPVLRTVQTAEALALAISSIALGRPWLLKLAISAVDEIELPQISWRWRMSPSTVYARADDCEQPSDSAPGSAPTAYDEAACRR